MITDQMVYDEIKLSNNGKLMFQALPVELVDRAKAMVFDGKLELATFMSAGDSIRIKTK